VWRDDATFVPYSEAKPRDDTADNPLTPKVRERVLNLSSVVRCVLQLLRVFDDVFNASKDESLRVIICEQVQITHDITQQPSKVFPPRALLTAAQLHGVKLDAANYLCVFTHVS
jgi:hypothetical protein